MPGSVTGSSSTAVPRCWCGNRAASCLVAFFDEVVDVTVDGVPRKRPDSPVATLMKDEFGVS